jgi:uncharacterized protein YecT (DUF1311 family)
MGESMPRLPLAVALVALVVIPATAQHMNQKESPCANVVVTVDLARCLSNAKDPADVRLNSVYNKTHERLDASDAQRLQAAQRLWIQYRDANCSAERDLYAGGTASGPAYLACLEAMTRARAKELEIMYVVKMK